MKNNILTFTLGMLFGIVFQHDIPIIKDIEAQSMRNYIVGIVSSVKGE
tara:strand:+ start:201 stop:344 length:144 start_codon:yes stop_codon:yes gene_type:complete